MFKSGKWTISWIAPSIFQTSLKDTAMKMFITKVEIVPANKKDEAEDPIESKVATSPAESYRGIEPSISVFFSNCS